MTTSLVTIGSILGGLGLFLLAVKVITDGLRMAAGNALRDLLWHWTSTTSRGIAAGLAITAIVQSSSAVTVATLGFVNAGFLSLFQALGVVYGANIGTTMTGWLVAIVGFKIKIELFALPLIGLGMLLRLVAGNRRLGALGEALAGFGLFFVGIDVLKTAFEGLAGSLSIGTFAGDNPMDVLLYLGLGFLMTVLTQSSSAAIAIILTAATGGILPLASAAAMVIGANVGTTSTAALAVIGATPNAKRVAAAHILFNLLTGCVAMLLLPAMLLFVRASSGLLGLADVPAVTLALFHTSFNLLGVFLLWPLTQRLAVFLSARFTTLEEIESRPKYLDKNVAVSPMLALHALTKELERISAIARRMAKGAMSAEFATSQRLRNDQFTLASLVEAIGDFMTHLERDKLPADVSDRLPMVLRSAQYFTACSELAVAIADAQTKLRPLSDEELAPAIAHLKSEVVALAEKTDISAEAFSLSECDTALATLLGNYHQLKADTLTASARRRIGVHDMQETLEQLSRTRRMAEQMLKGTHYLLELYQFVALPPDEEKPQGTDEAPPAADSLVPEPLGTAESGQDAVSSAAQNALRE